MTDTRVANDFVYDPFSIEAMEAPAQFYPKLRESFPAYFMPQYDAWAFTRFADVWGGFLDSEHFSEVEGQIFSKEQLLISNSGAAPTRKLDPFPIFNYLDPPVHTRFRQVMAPALLKPTVNRMEPLLTQLVRDRLDLLLERGEFDLNYDFASYISAGATCLVEGIPLTEVPDVIRLVNGTVARDTGQPGFTEAGARAGAELFGRLLAHVAAHRAAGAAAEPNLLLDALLGSEFLGRRLTDNEVASNLSAILVGGSETLPKVFAGGLLELWKRPRQLAEVVANLPQTAASTFEEMLRYSAPAQWFGRTVKKPRSLGGADLQPGQRVLLIIAAANRDPREFDDPETFIWNRKVRRLLSFGIGPHFCIGIHLARLEGQIMLRELLKVAPRFEIEPSRGHWATSEFQVGWTRLPIKIAG